MKVKFVAGQLFFAYRDQSKIIFENLDLELQSGINLLFGPSGSGKSTLLKLINLDLFLSAGQLEIDGKFVDQLLPDEIAAVKKKIYFPDRTFFPHYRTGDNLALTLKADSESLDAAKKRIYGQLPARLKRQFYLPYHQLSAGEKNIIDRWLIEQQKAEVVLLDEPSASLSDRALEEFVDSLSALDQSLVVIATNDERLRALKDRFKCWQLQDRGITWLR